VSEHAQLRWATKRLQKPGDATAYRGYIIRRLFEPHGYSVSRDGFHIATVTTVGAALRAVDEVVG
jgi:hypothetical protein